MNLFQLGDFRLHSGEPSKWKIECDALTPPDWDTLAQMLVERLYWPFCDVVGVPTGGEPFALALRKHCTTGTDRWLVVDDVWTTGGSMHDFLREYSIHHNPPMKAVVFSRNINLPKDVVAIFTIAPVAEIILR